MEFLPKDPTLTVPEATVKPSSYETPLDSHLKAMTSWTTIEFVDFDTHEPPDDWYIDAYDPTVHGQTPTLASWNYTTYRSHSGEYSCYCASGGTAAVAAPGPAPVNMHGVLVTSAYNFSTYEEVYLDFWFWSENEITVDAEGQLQFWDYPTVHIGSQMADKIVTINGLVGLYMEWVGENGTFAQDPTSQGGWMHLLYRVPDDLRVSDAYFEFRYHSDDNTQFEGAYIDDIRIVGTTNVDMEALGNDPYSARHWDKKNTGQIAGYGTDANDLKTTPTEAWSLVTPSADIILAIVDDGVEPTHPDLNLIPGYDFDGAAGGAPRGDPRGSHGTSCAGDAGAIGNNSTGVMGQAPGCKIMPVYVWGPTEADIANAIGVAVANGADILSNSWGWVGAPNTDITNAITAALTANRIVLFAAGNGPDRVPFTYDVAFPGNLTGSTDIICVGASSPTDEHKSASSSDGLFGWGSSFVGSGPDVYAPGPWSYTTDLLGADGYNPGSTSVQADYTHDFGGTSSATPKVAGIVALMLSKNPNLTPLQVKTILKTTADPMTATGNLADMTGSGRVNAYNAIQAVPVAPATGAIGCTITPAEAVTAGAQWRVDGGAWQNTGVTVSGLSVGSHTVSFKAITGWTTPADQNVNVIADQTTSITGTYVAVIGTGAINCTIAPTEAVTAGAQWRVDGGAWQNTGATISGLAAGGHTVSFKAIGGWTTPADQNVNVTASQTASITGTYTAAATTGAISCTITPADAVTAGAQWRVDGGTWQNTGVTVSGLSVGSHTVSFKAIAGWTTPADQNVNVLASQAASITGTYTAAATTGAISCTITPAAAVTAGAQWRVDSGAWQASGATVSSLTPGTYTVSFVALMGWTAPASQSVSVVAGVTAQISGTYTAAATTGAVSCTITPADAVTAGAQWRMDAGTWQNSGATVSDLAAGSHTVSFVALSGWTPPVNQTVDVVAGETTNISAIYQVEENTGCGCAQSKQQTFKKGLRGIMGDFLLVGVSLTILIAISRTKDK